MVVKQALPKLRVEAEWFSDPTRVHREAAGIRWLSAILAGAAFASVPELLFEDEQYHVIGMTAVPRPHENLKTLFLAGVVGLDVVERCALLLACIHAKSAQLRTQPETLKTDRLEAGPTLLEAGSTLLEAAPGRGSGGTLGESLSSSFSDLTFFQGLRLEPYYEFTAGKVPQASAFLRKLIDDTLAVAVALVHGDFSPKNILIHGGRPFLLDHEVIHWGDPAFDLGFMLTHLLSKARHLPHHRERFVEAANRFWTIYADQAREAAWWSGVEERAIRHTIACMLARVRGRSPLDYLVPVEKDTQAAVMLQLIKSPPQSLPELIGRATTER
jgi:hypothetical protein